ncbi:MAG: 3-isopropylmalate dehydratase small subunit [Rhodospirillaceae bacterium]
MIPFTTLTGPAAPLPLANIDTDAIMPKQFLKTIKRSGLGKFVFNDMRFQADGREKSDFVLNRNPYRHATTLIAGVNFGCGSSREHAPWGLADFGIRCVIAPSFADIFASNCMKNGILCITLPPDDVEALTALVSTPATSEVTVDLPLQAIVTAKGRGYRFDIEPARKALLLAGLDEIGVTLQHENDIARFELARVWREPWRNTGTPGHD